MTSMTSGITSRPNCKRRSKRIEGMVFKEVKKSDKENILISQAPSDPKLYLAAKKGADKKMATTVKTTNSCWRVKVTARSFWLSLSFFWIKAAPRPTSEKKAKKVMIKLTMAKTTKISGVSNRAKKMLPK